MFHNLNLQFADVAAFASWLATQQRPQWDDPIIGSTYHNTFIPTAAQWRGRSSMLSMQRTYAAKKWDRGPHCYLALGTAADGIFVMTPPWLEGIHSPSCNGKRFGIEVVGDFQATPMRADQLQLLTDVAAALHRYAGIVGGINAHRDCDWRTCPGDAAYAQKSQIQLLLAEKLAALPAPSAPRYTELSPLLGTGRASAERIMQLLLAKNTDPKAEYQEPAIREIVGAYVEICARAGLNSDLVLAQMIHETNWLRSFFAARPRRNPAGIGVTGDKRPGNYPQPQPAALWHLDATDPAVPIWRLGLAFPTWAQHAIPAHVGRLLAWILPLGVGSPEQLALRSQGLAARALPSVCFGSVTTLKDLGKVHNRSGYGWADDGKLYGQMIAKIATSLVGDL